LGSERKRGAPPQGFAESPPHQHRLAHLWTLLHSVCASVLSPRTAEGSIGREPACFEPSRSAQPTTRVTRGASAQGGRGPMPGLPQRGEHPLPAKRKRANEPPPPTHGARMQPNAAPSFPVPPSACTCAHADLRDCHPPRARPLPPPPPRGGGLARLTRGCSSHQTHDALPTACAHRLTATTWNV